MYLNFMYYSCMIVKTSCVGLLMKNMICKKSFGFICIKIGLWIMNLGMNILKRII